MRRIDRTRVTWCWLVFAAACLRSSALPAAEEPNEALIQMVVELVGDTDRDMRALGLQQVREEVPGEAATKRFTALLPDLPPDGQAGLLEALGDRGDRAARPAVLDMLKSPEETVRVAALRALGPLGSASEVSLLAGKAASGSEQERSAARRALIRLRGEDVNRTLITAMAEGGADVRVELLGVLAARNAKEALPAVLESVGHQEASVRLAALGAVRFLADESDTAAVVKILKAAQDETERRQAELALLVVSGRGREACAEPIIAGLEGADVPSRVALLHALARAGGRKAREAVVARLEDDDRAVRDEAVRMLSIWRDPGVKPHLLAIAGKTENIRHQVLAIRGLVRLATPQEDKPADLELLAEAMSLAKRPQEKRLVLGVLGSAGTAKSLPVVTPAQDDPALVEEAGLAAVMIAERIEDGNGDMVRAAMEAVLNRVKNQQVRQRAQKVLDSF